MTSFESLSLLMQLATVMFAGFSIAVTLIILIINKKGSPSNVGVE